MYFCFAQIITALTDEHDVRLDADLTPQQRASGTAIQRMTEEHLYFVVVWGRWWRDEGWAIAGPAYFGSLPAPIRKLIPALIRKSVKKALVGQGMGRLTPEPIGARAKQDLEALLVLLGDQPFFLGDKPHGIDATTYGILAAIIKAPIADDCQRTAKSYANLVDYVARMDERYWPPDRTAG